MPGLLIALFLLMAGPAPAEVRSGAAAVVITPPKSIPMAGYYSTRYSEGTHDDLYAKALVIETNGTRVALIACDLIGIPRGVIDEARRRIEAETRIPATNIMISATHTHTGPMLADGGPPHSMDESAYALVREYTGSLPARLTESVRLAIALLKPVRVSAALGNEPSLTFNRRFHMTDGTVGWNPGKRNPKIIRPAGPVDPDVAVLTFQTPDGKTQASYVNYALHLDTVGGKMFSADYPKTLSMLLSEVQGSSFVNLFTLGCAGNLNHIDVSTAERQQGNGEAARIGTVLAAEVLQTFKKLQPVEAERISVRQETLNLLFAPYTPDDLKWANGIVIQPETAQIPFLDRVRAYRIVEVAGREKKPVDAEVQVIALGDQLAWVGLPGEIFAELGMTIKKSSPFQHTIVVSLANGSLNYFPDRKAFMEGAYEPTSSRYAVGSGERLVEMATRLLIEGYEANSRK